MCLSILYVFRYQVQKCAIVLCIFLCLFISVHTCILVPPIRASMSDTYMNPEVEFTAFKIVLRNFDYDAWDQVYNKNRIFFQISDTNL